MTLTAIFSQAEMDGGSEGDLAGPFDVVNHLAILEGRTWELRGICHFSRKLCVTSGVI